MRGLLANRILLSLLVLLAAGAEFGVALMSHPAARAAAAAGGATPASARAMVSAAVRACPSPGSAGVTAGGIAVATASAGAGQAAVSRLSPAGSAVAGAALRVLAEPDRALLVTIPKAPVPSRRLAAQQAPTAGAVPTGPTQGGVMVQAAASMARGLEVEQTGPGGFATARCSGPGTDFWFVGPGQHSVADIQLYLMDTDGQPATAEVDVFTDSGPLLGSSDTGIAVPAHGMIVQSLAKLVRDSRVLGLHVSTSVGRVVAAVWETASLRQPGAWLPVAQAPATSLVLPGLPATSGTRDLYVVVPGTGNAQVKLTAVTGKGSYQPTGGGGIDLPGGSAVQIALPSLSGIASAVKLTSNVPVTATMLAPGGAAGAPGAFTAATGPVQQQGVISGSLGGPGGAVSLVLSAPQRAARVQIGTQTLTSAATDQVVQVGAGQTVVVKIRAPAPAGKSTPFAISITALAGSGPVYAGRVLSVSGTLRSILPVSSSLSWVLLPPVRSSVTVAVQSSEG